MNYVILIIAILQMFLLFHYREITYSLPKSEYNQLTDNGKVWAYVRKDGKL